MICPVRNRMRLITQFKKIDRRLRADAARDTAIKQLFHVKVGQSDLYEPVLANSVVDDPRVTMPGIAVLPGSLMFTNFHPFQRRVADVIEKKLDPLGIPEGFRVAQSYAPSFLRIAALIDGDNLQPWLQQSADGWAYEQTVATNMDYIAWRQAANRAAQRAGLERGSDGYAAYVEREIGRQEKDITEVKRPQLKRDINQYIDDFEGFLAGIGIFVEDTSGGVRMSLRIDPKEQ